MKLRVVVADDHTVVLDGLRAVLALEADVDVVAACTDGLEAIEAVEAHKPDVLVMDAAMPRCDGLEAHERMRGRGLRVPTVILSATLTDKSILRCVKSGVEGIVLKESAASILIDAIRAVAGGERWMPTELSNRALEAIALEESATETPLTAREEEIALLVAEGLPNKRVAARLGIAESTVKLHLHSAFAKLGVANRVQLSLVVRERGWM